MFIGDSRLREQFVSIVQHVTDNTTYFDYMHAVSWGIGTTHTFYSVELNLKVVRILRLLVVSREKKQMC